MLLGHKMMGNDVSTIDFMDQTGWPIGLSILSPVGVARVIPVLMFEPWSNKTGLPFMRLHCVYISNRYMYIPIGKLT